MEKKPNKVKQQRKQSNPTKKNNKVSLVATGFEESPVKQNDSPICSKKCLQLM